MYFLKIQINKKRTLILVLYLRRKLNFPNVTVVDSHTAKYAIGLLLNLSALVT